MVQTCWKGGIIKATYRNISIFLHHVCSVKKPEDQWSCIAHLSAEDMLKSAVIEENKFKHRPRVGADNP